MRGALPKALVLILLGSVKGTLQRYTSALWGAAPEGEAPREPESVGSSAQSVPDYVGEDLTRALSTPERMRPDHAWSLDVQASLAAGALVCPLHLTLQLPRCRCVILSLMTVHLSF